MNTIDTNTHITKESKCNEIFAAYIARDKLETVYTDLTIKCLATSMH